MDAVDYVLTKRKICRMYPCTDCPLYPCVEAGTAESEAKKHVEAVRGWKEKQEKKETENLLKATFEKITGKKDAAEVRIEGKSIVIGTDFESIRIGGDDGKA